MLLAINHNAERTAHRTPVLTNINDPMCGPRTRSAIADLYPVVTLAGPGSSLGGRRKPLRSQDGKANSPDIVTF